MMAYLEQSDGVFDDSSGEILIRFEAKGTRYDGRTEQIEKSHRDDRPFQFPSFPWMFHQEDLLMFPGYPQYSGYRILPRVDE